MFTVSQTFFKIAFIKLFFFTFLCILSYALKYYFEKTS